MLERALEYRDCIRKCIYNAESLTRNQKALNLSNDDWLLVQDLMEILHPIKELTLIVSQENSGAAEVIPVLHFVESSLKESKERLVPSDDLYLAIEAALDKLQHYYDQLTPLAGIVLMLDPSKKDVFLRNINWKEDWIDQALTAFKDAYSFYEAQVEDNTSASAIATEIASKKRKFPTFSEFYKKDQAVYTSAKEIERYLSSPPVPVETDPLQWWKANQKVYPVLSVMVKDYFGIQASSVSAERLFSSGGDLVTPNRCRLSGQTVERVQFLKYSIKNK
jgi:hypothetical protein